MHYSRSEQANAENVFKCQLQRGYSAENATALMYAFWAVWQTAQIGLPIIPESNLGVKLCQSWLVHSERMYLSTMENSNARKQVITLFASMTG